MACRGWVSPMGPACWLPLALEEMPADKFGKETPPGPVFKLSKVPPPGFSPLCPGIRPCWWGATAVREVVLSYIDDNRDDLDTFGRQEEEVSESISHFEKTWIGQSYIRTSRRPPPPLRTGDLESLPVLCGWVFYNQQLVRRWETQKIQHLHILGFIVFCVDSS
jgi:hypothetical protein